MRIVDHPYNRLAATASKKGFRQASPQIKILLLFLYYTLLRSFLQFFGGAGAPHSRLLDRAITVMPFVLTTAWMLAHFQSHRPGRRSTILTRPVPGGMFLFLNLFCIVLLYAALLGLRNSNPATLTEIQKYVIFLPLAVMSFVSIRDGDEIRQLLGWFLPALFSLALLRFLYYVAIWFGIGVSFSDTWTNGILVSLGYCLYLIRYLLEDKRDWKDTIVLLVFAGAILITFHKPMVWSITIATAVMVWIVFRLKQYGSTVKRLTALFLLGVVFLLVADTMSGRSVFESYRTTFYLKYLKADPLTGRPLPTSDLDGGRVYIWQEALIEVRESPIVGHGLGSLVAVKGDREVATHNTVVYFLLATGGVGVFVVSRLFLYWLLPVLRSFRGEEPSLKLGLFGFVVFVMAFGLIGTIWVRSNVVYLLAIALGLSLKMALIDKQGKHA